MAIVKYKTKDGDSLTPCPFGKNRNVFSIACKECYYFGTRIGSSEIVCHYNEANPEVKKPANIRQWEHLIVPIDGDDGIVRKRLNEKGAQGWELVTVSGSRAYFKREIQDGNG